ncbi:MAG: hypothetical protein ACP5NS_03965 [Candidatus Pacearchaeota archaeon]
MTEDNISRLVVASSYVTGREIYRGSDISEAERLGKESGDKHTLYVFEETQDTAKLIIDRRYGIGFSDSTETIRMSSWELKHFKTLVGLIR